MRRARGFSLVELITVIVVIGTLAVFVGPVLLNAVRAYGSTQATVATYAKMRYAMERMAREIAAVRRNPANTAAFDVSSMVATNLSFTKEDGTQVTIAAGGGNLNLTYVGTGTFVLADRVSALNFAYYRHDGATATAAASELEFVEIAMTIGDGTTSFANRVRVGLRNVQ
jgi:prepilin-type N-terminal cleavage/methylation domain-containing protein